MNKYTSKPSAITYQEDQNNPNTYNIHITNKPLQIRFNVQFADYGFHYGNLNKVLLYIRRDNNFVTQRIFHKNDKVSKNRKIVLF